MEDFLASSFLAIVQGATEFLPISSSAHLVLFQNWLGWSGQGLAFNIAVHVGTLVATLIYFRTDLVKILKGWIHSVSGNGTNEDAKLGWLIIVASIPVGVFGLLLHEFIASSLSGTLVIASTTLVFAVWLWYSDFACSGKRTVSSLGYKDAVLIGLAQALALVPGTSRSGATISMGLTLGMTRQDATRFAFLLAIPAISMAGSWQFVTLALSDAPVDWGLIAYSAAIACVVAYTVIRMLLKFVERIGMLPFVIYRILIALFLFSTMLFI